MGKKSEWRFAVHFLINRLLSVASMHGTLFAKIKLNGSRIGSTERKGITEFQVIWDQSFDFECVMTANAQGVLNPCILKVAIFKVCAVLLSCDLDRSRSLLTSSTQADFGLVTIFHRQETRFGRDQVGCARINLAEYAELGAVSRKYILEGAETQKRRHDNSILQVCLMSNGFRPRVYCPLMQLIVSPQVTVTLSKKTGEQLFRAYAQLPLASVAVRQISLRTIAAW
jgi:hypothetical protein